MQSSETKLTAVCARILLTDRSAVYKTERFLQEVKDLAGVDGFLSKITDAILLKGAPNEGSYRVSAASHTFFFKVVGSDLIFFGYRSAEKAVRLNDRRIVLFMAAHPEFEFTLAQSQLSPGENDTKKLYRLSEAADINYPKLNSAQRAIVEAEDRSVIVQGVAGSGKTNLCIDKALFTAARNYRGKTLYTTFSRGLLIETNQKLNAVRDNILKLLKADAEGNVVVRGTDIARALEYKSGVYLPNAENWKTQLQNIADYIENKIDCLLPEDLYRRQFGDVEVANEDYFIKVFMPDCGKVQGLFKRLSALGAEVVYKEIYGYLFGRARPYPTESQYIDERRGSLTTAEAEAIYRIAAEYRNYMLKNGVVDNTVIAEKLNGTVRENYSIAIIDEVQDLTEKELNLFKNISLKIFAVGDALQMINPSYFSFSYLKTLMGGGNSLVGELKHNYRSTQKIAELTEELGELNMSLFGTHNFVLRSRTVDSDVDTAAVYVHGGKLLELLNDQKLEGYTVIVNDFKRKAEIKKRFPGPEVLTVSEAKGLERDTVILYDVLTDSAQKWSRLERMKIDRKRADENSVYRYYFNLFYVGVTRAKRSLIVYEDLTVPLFKRFFGGAFNAADAEASVKKLTKTLLRVETDDKELQRRAAEFIRLGQYDNAVSAADSMRDDVLRRATLAETEIHRGYVRKGDYRGAGIRFWTRGMYEKAREMFVLSKDRSLIDLMDAATGKGGRLDYAIVDYFTEIDDPAARQLILETLNEDLNDLKTDDKKVYTALRRIRSKYGQRRN